NSESNRIVVNLEQPQTVAPPQVMQNAPRQNVSTPSFLNESKPKKSGGCFGKILLTLGVLLIVAIVGGGIGGYLWWQSLQKSPAYSLALLVDAARRNDQKTIDQYLDNDAVVDSFVPQVTEKATERYGRGVPTDILNKAKSLTKNITPLVKDRARQEIPTFIKQKAQLVPEVSPWIMAIGIGRVATVKENGDTATLGATLPNQPNRPIEITMKKNGDKWKVIAVKDDALADQIAQKIAEQLQGLGNKKISELGQKAASGNLEEVRKQFENLLPK
ncbi:MAG: hypothetical protein H7Z37_06375, partial [Pyrinomonadaceae bacterium]|nr:hypothetical protein [Pyrinomonadaceae bacterium]